MTKVPTIQYINLTSLVWFVYMVRVSKLKNSYIIYYYETCKIVICVNNFNNNDDHTIGLHLNTVLYLYLVHKGLVSFLSMRVLK